jgi:hypothetical protein
MEKIGIIVKYNRKEKETEDFWRMINKETEEFWRMINKEPQQ